MYSFSFFNSDSIDTRDLFQSHFAHSLFKFFLASVSFFIPMLITMLMIVIAVIIMMMFTIFGWAVFLLSLWFCCFFWLLVSLGHFIFWYILYVQYLWIFNSQYFNHIYLNQLNIYFSPSITLTSMIIAHFISIYNINNFITIVWIFNCIILILINKSIVSVILLSKLSSVDH